MIIAEFVDLAACRGCAVDSRGDTTITTRKTRFLLFGPEEVQVTTQYGPPVLVR
jgi:hypothetical protein